MNTKTQQNISAYTMLIPILILIAIFYIFPFIISMINSLYTGLPGNYHFCGLDNYKNIFSSSRFWNSLWMTTRFTFLSSIILFVFGFMLAEFTVRKKLLFKSFSSSAILMPYIITPAIAIMVWQYMFDGNHGILNYFLSLVNIDRVGWLRSPTAAFRSLVTVQLWFTIGYIMVIFTSGLQSIPDSYYEAAAIDGAGYWQSSFKISLPLILPTTVFVLIMLLLAGYVNSFTLASLLTGGGPIESTEVYMLYLYRIAFGDFNIPASNALTMIIFVILFAFARIVKKLQSNLFSSLY